MTKTNTAKALLFTAGLSVLGTVAYAAGPKADLNQDEIVTKAEFTLAANARFEAADINGDGRLDETERRTMGDARRSKDAARAFARLDANGDGAVTQAEMEAAMAARKAKHEARKAKRSERRAEGRPEARPEGRPEGRKGMRRGGKMRMDTDKDGFVSTAEYQAMTDQLFTRMDANGDGQLTKGEGKRRRGKRRG